MNTIETFPGLVGFYTLTPEGQLGFYGQDKKFVLDAKLTKTFIDYNGRYLMAYLQNPAQGNFRLAIIHRTQEKRPWGSDTLLLEKHIIRRLYPVTGMTTDKDLTAFQKKNQEKSIFRGMELFLDYKDGSNPGMPVFCPVLYDRNATLDDYASILDRPIASADRETPVVEILNLLAAIPMGRRDAAEITILKDKIYQGAVKKGMRKPSDFRLIDDVRGNTQAAGETAGDDCYDGVDKRAERKVTLDSGGTGGKGAENRLDVNVLIKNIATSLVGHPEPADPMALKIFTRFRDLDHDKLEAIAAQSLIYKVPPGTQLLERGTSDSLNLYLLDGTVKLVAADGVGKFVDGGTAAASNPVSYLKPRMYTVSAFTRVAFLWIDDKLIDEIVRGKAALLHRDAAS
jgi:hypothetical protein